MLRNVIASAVVAGGLVGGLTVGGIAGAATPTAPAHATSADAARLHQWVHAHRKELRHEGVVVSASTIGISPQALRAALTAGSSIASVAASHGSSGAAVDAALDQKAVSGLDMAVAAGTLSSAQASAIEARLPGRINALVTHVF